MNNIELAVVIAEGLGLTKSDARKIVDSALA